MFEQTGVLWVTPGGQNEHPEAWGSVIKWGALNIGAEASHDPDWTRQRQLMTGAGVTSFPWLHIRSMTDLYRLIDTADRWGTRIAGVNIEDVVGDQLNIATIAQELKEWGGQALIIVLPWLPNGQGWSQLADYPFAIEYFPFDPAWDHAFDDRRVLAYHACQEIGKNAKLSWLYGTYPSGVANPYSYNYDLGVAHSFYTGDAIGTAPSAWHTWNYSGTTSYVRCNPDNGDVPPIGDQDGIVAACNRLRDLDPKGTLLVKSGGKWPSLDTLKNTPIDQWKAWDKFQRTLQILKDDHDAAG